MKRWAIAIHWTGGASAALLEASAAAGGQLEVARTGRFEPPPETPVGPALAAELASAGFRSKKAVVVLPAEQGVLRFLRLPAALPAELDAMIRLQVEKDLPFPLEKGRVAYRAFPVEEGPSGTRNAERGTRKFPGELLVAVAVVRSEVFDRHCALVEEAGLELVGMTLSPLAILAATRGLASDPAPIRGILLAEGARLWVHFHDTKGNAVAHAIALGDHHLEDGVLPWREAFRREFSRTLNAFRARSGETGELAVVVSGDDADREGLVQAALACGAARAGSPDSLPGGVPAAFAACAGALARVPLESPAADFTALPSKGPRFRLAKTHLVIAGIAAGALLVLGVPQAIESGKKSTVEELSTELARLKSERKRLKPEVERAVRLSEWDSNRFPWIDVLADLTDLVDNRQAILTEVRGLGAKQELRISGKARSLEAAQALYNRIQESGKYQAKLTKNVVSDEKSAGAGGEFPATFELELVPVSSERTRMTQPIPEERAAAGGPGGKP